VICAIFKQEHEVSTAAQLCMDSHKKKIDEGYRIRLAAAAAGFFLLCICVCVCIMLDRYI